MCAGAAVDAGGLPSDSSGDTLPAASGPAATSRPRRAHVNSASADATSPAGDASGDSAAGPTIGGGYHAAVGPVMAHIPRGTIFCMRGIALFAFQVQACTTAASAEAAFAKSHTTTLE